MGFMRDVEILWEDLLEAFDKLEVLENAARMTLIVDLAGKKKPLGRLRVLEIERLFR